MNILEKKPIDKDGLYHGYHEAYRENGNIWFKGNFIHGKAKGLIEGYGYDNDMKYKDYYIP